MAGLPRLREAAWLVTGPDRWPLYHLQVRLYEAMDGSGVWTLKVRECRPAGPVEHRSQRCYATEAEARADLQQIYELGRRQLPTRQPGLQEEGRWRVRVHPPDRYDLQLRARRTTQAGKGEPGLALAPTRQSAR